MGWLDGTDSQGGGDGLDFGSGRGVPTPSRPMSGRQGGRGIDAPAADRLRVAGLSKTGLTTSRTSAAISLRVKVASLASPSSETFTDPPVTFAETANCDGNHSAHNIVIDEEIGMPYAVGSRMGGETCGGGLHMIDVRTPPNPSSWAASPTAPRDASGPATPTTPSASSTGGWDEDYQGREICFGANETALSIADVTDRREPRRPAPALVATLSCGEAPAEPPTPPPTASVPTTVTVTPATVRTRPPEWARNRPDKTPTSRAPASGEHHTRTPGPRVRLCASKAQTYPYVSHAGFSSLSI